MRPRSAVWRKLQNQLALALSAVSALVGLFFLGWILYTVVQRGGQALGWDFFTKLPPPPGEEGGGLANAIVGTMLMTGMAAAIGIPIGILGGVYLAEFGRRSSLASAVRFCTNVLMGVPSIIVGVFVYTLIVVRTASFSAYAGAVSLAIIMLPVVGRTTEDIVNLVPNTLRESALALGSPRWKVTFSIVFRAAKPGLVTGCLLAIARVSGETAPLLFTALNNSYWMRSLNEPVANLTVTIFSFAMSPFDNWIQMAWGASLLITVGVLFLDIVARIGFRQKGAR